MNHLMQLQDLSLLVANDGFVDVVCLFLYILGLLFEVINVVFETVELVVLVLTHNVNLIELS